MGRTTHVVITDDLDGRTPAQTYRLAWQGVDYEIDLNDEHRDQLLALLAPYLEAGRRVRPRRLVRKRRRGQPGDPAVRAWARAAGLVLEPGPVPPAVRAKFKSEEALRQLHERMGRRVTPGEGTSAP